MELSSDGLRTLAAVVHHGTFEAAAHALHITPSAVSQRIKAMETGVGRVLVRRTKPISVTGDGEVLLRLARQWELLTAETTAHLTGEDIAAAGALVERPRIHLPIASNADSLATWLLPALARVHHEQPVVVEVIRDDESQNSGLLRSGEVAGAITSEPVTIRGCDLRALGSMRYVPVATPDFLAEWMPDGPTDAALSRAPMVVFDRNDHLQRNVLRSITAAAAEPPSVYIPGSDEYQRAVRLGMGWGAVPIAQISAALDSGEVVPFVDSFVDVPLFWQFWRVSSPLLGALTQAVVAAASTTLIAPT